jgi:hypothetical protein
MDFDPGKEFSMRWCPSCKSEWIEAVNPCPQCGAPTEDEATQKALQALQEAEAEVPFVNLGTVGGPIEESLVAEVFTQEGIPHFIRNRGNDNVGMMLVGQEGWARVFVSATHEAEAQTLLDAIRNEDATDELNLELASTELGSESDP